MNRINYTLFDSHSSQDILKPHVRNNISLLLKSLDSKKGYKDLIFYQGFYLHVVSGFSQSWMRTESLIVYPWINCQNFRQLFCYFQDFKTHNIVQINRLYLVFHIWGVIGKSFDIMETLSYIILFSGNFKECLMLKGYN